MRQVGYLPRLDEIFTSTCFGLCKLDGKISIQLAVDSDLYRAKISFGWVQSGEKKPCSSF
jgi:hypothetical protein